MIRSGSLCMDYSYSFPDYGIIEFIAYPNSGLTTILLNLAIRNPNKSITYFSRDDHIDYPNNVKHVKNMLSEKVIDIIFEDINNGSTDIIIIDTFADLVSEQEIEIVSKQGIGKLDNAIKAKIWFDAFRLMAEICEQKGKWLVIGNLRKTKLNKKMKYGYDSNRGARQSAQDLDKYGAITINLEVNRRSTKEDGRIFMYLDNWMNRRKEKGITIPVMSGKVLHSLEKLYILQHRKEAIMMGSEIYYKNKLYSKLNFLKFIGDDYNFNFITKQNEVKDEYII